MAICYPLVNVYITMESHHFSWEIHYKWLCSIVVMAINYQFGLDLPVKHGDFPYKWRLIAGKIHLANVDISMANHHFSWETHYKRPCSIAMSNYQRVYAVELSIWDVPTIWINMIYSTIDNSYMYQQPINNICPD